MRIKFNDKIYRLKEIESGVDSLMELVEEQKYKNGDFVYEDGRIMIIKSYPNMYHANAYPKHRPIVFYNDWYAVDFSSPTFRHATEEEKQLLIDAMKKDGKQWNAEKKCIEDIPKRKFNIGDKVVLKSGYKKSDGLKYLAGFDYFVGKPLTIKGYTDTGYVHFYDCIYVFDEDWLEPWSDELKNGEEPKRGDWAIFWDNKKLMPLTPLIRLYHGKTSSGNKHIDNFGIPWDNAVKWDGTKEQFEKIRSGKV